MRGCICWWAIGALLLASGCEQPAARAKVNAPRHSISQLGFATLASAEQLGAAWQAGFHSRPRIQAVELAPDSSFALVTLARRMAWATDANAAPVVANVLWVKFDPAGAKTTPLALPGEVVSIDTGLGQVVCEADGHYTLFDLASQTSKGVDAGPAMGLPGGSAQVRDVADDQILWSYVPPHMESAGTSRAAAAAQAGNLTMTSFTAGAPKTAATGSLTYSSLAGDAKHERAFMALDGAGVALVSFADGDKAQPLRWLVRDSGDAQFFLQPAAGKLVVANDEGLLVIGLDDLAKLAPSLAVGEQLDARQTKLLKPATEALGWDWPQVQLNPLNMRPGVQNLLDSSDADSTTAELDWSPATQHALRLLITRRPRAVDEKLRTADETARKVMAAGLLQALGWPQARLAEVQPSAASGEAQLEFVLDPDAKAPRDPGRFSLWLTPDAAVYELRAATAALPAGAMAEGEARVKALAAAQAAAAVPAVYPASTARFGWAQPHGLASRQLMSEEAAGTAAYYSFEFLQLAPQRSVYTVLVPANTGAVEPPVGAAASLETLRRARAGEFGAEAKAALATPAPPPAPQT